MIEFFAHGTPITQGSAKAFVVKGRAVVTNKTRGLETWRMTIAFASQAHAQLIDGPVTVQLAFELPRPQTLPKRRYTWPVGARSGDSDKLARSALDALTGVLWRDDSQVTDLLVSKRYADADGRIGVFVRVTPTTHASPRITWEPIPSETPPLVAEGGA